MEGAYGYFVASVMEHATELEGMLGNEWQPFSEHLAELDDTEWNEVLEEISRLDLPEDAAHLLESLLHAAVERSIGDSAPLSAPAPTRSLDPSVEYENMTRLDIARHDSTEPSSDTAERREIIVSGHTVDGQQTTRFARGQRYRLRCRVDAPTLGNLVNGDAGIESIPPEGLKTLWVITSTNVEIIPELTPYEVTRIGDAWRVQFELLIPGEGPSDLRELGVIGPSGRGDLQLTLYTVAPDNTREIYRELTVAVNDGLEVTQDEISKSPQYTHLRTTHEWTTPPEHIQVSLLGGTANVSTKRFLLQTYEFAEPFSATNTTIAGAINNVRSSLDNFREQYGDYLDDIDPNDMRQRVNGTGWQPYENANGWSVADAADAAHRAAFDRAQSSSEWRAMASDGYYLFNLCFPQGSQLRAVLEKLQPGSRVDFHWTEQSGAGFVSHVPWSLMYMEPIGITSKVDPEKFLGLRYRICSRTWRINNGSVVLGRPDQSLAMNILYWGRNSDDDVGSEADWQAREFAGWNPGVRTIQLPDATVPDLKQQIRLAFDAPGPSPVSVIYFYCHCSVGNGVQPLLRFGSTSKAADVIGRVDLSQTAIPDGPLVFANACSTATADPLMTSELEQAFFQRGIRAFIGTESKVPIRLASRFAWLYFQFLYRRVDQAPMSAGEALTQARMFLWTQYRNVGGLFYSLSNQYDLYLASQAEVLALR